MWKVYVLSLIGSYLSPNRVNLEKLERKDFLDALVLE